MTSSSRSVIILASIVIFVNGLVLRPVFQHPALDHSRVGHIILAATMILFVFLMKKRWTTRTTIISFIVLFLPVFPMSWFAHVEYASIGTQLTPFLSFKLFFAFFALLVPGPYWLNLTLMTAFAIESLILWFHLESKYSISTQIQDEPWNTMLYFGTSLCLLGFRYRDEKIIHRLSRDKARAEVFENLAKIFLTIRDRANTPLQSLKIIGGILRQRHPEETEIIEILDRSVLRIEDMNKILVPYESEISWSGDELMSDAEILKWLEETKEQFQRNNRDSSVSG